ncbi:lactosylceramide 4-alpha-galactosyltransferase-like isoform X2 [Penaeus chinensis]|uniref:lactosylceramide 4-alpha-galactosyltransferase-like isoform X2 n=1 Tax=Penaeus chinensis TaxID=139456 RepID=UPI001FB74D1A|nr:lactosylceramide 4-alpha-galactosyltransferase-like isoform X2 [Penaeus chinensis]
MSKPRDLYIAPKIAAYANHQKQGSNMMKRCLGYILLTTMACSMITYYFMNPQIAEYSFRLDSISEPSTTHHFPWWREVLCDGTNQQGSWMLELPLLQRDVEPPESDDNIFLVETACKTTPSFRVWCAIESWSRQNPSSQVWYVMTSLTVNDTDGLVSRLQEQYSNLRIVGADVEKIFNGTGLYGLFSSRKWIMNAKWPAVKLSDLIRVALLWRWGGFYTDTDTVCIKDVSPLRNVISFSNSKRTLISNGAFQFHHHHKFLELLMEVQTKGFKPATWGSLGPEAVSTVAKKLCNVKNFMNFTGSKDDPVECEDLTLLPPKYLLPLDWTQNKRLFAKGSGEYFFKLLISLASKHPLLSPEIQLHLRDPHVQRRDQQQESPHRREQHLRNRSEDVLSCHFQARDSRVRYLLMTYCDQDVFYNIFL